MTFVCLIAAIAGLIGGAALVYLATPHQALAPRPWPGRRSLAGGGILLLMSLCGFLGVMGPATAVFAFLTGLMLLWTVPPVLIAWLGREKADR